MYLFFDTETTGFPKDGLPLASQPHLVQLAALLMDDKGQEVSMCNFIIKPDGYQIPDDVAKIHGITTDIAIKYGISLPTAIQVFQEMASQAEILVAHNIQFDTKIIAIAKKRLAGDHASMAHKTQFCTMEATKPICQLPPTDRMVSAGISGFKSPKLMEAYEFLFQEKFEKAHDALADVRACAKVYFKIKEPSNAVPTDPIAS